MEEDEALAALLIPILPESEHFQDWREDERQQHAGADADQRDDLVQIRHRPRDHDCKGEGSAKNEQDLST